MSEFVFRVVVAAACLAVVSFALAKLAAEFTGRKRRRRHAWREWHRTSERAQSTT